MLGCILSQTASADSPSKINTFANDLYKQGKFDQALQQYDQALSQTPQAYEPKFNKADSYYRLNDLRQAADLYRQVADESKDQKLIAMSKYNLGNCDFQQGTKLKDSDPKKAIENFKTAISNWRAVLDNDPKNQKAANNIEVARLTIKDIIEQMKNQQQDPNQSNDPNQSQDPNQPQDPNRPQQQPQDPNQSKDPNQPQDPNKSQSQAAKQDPNQSQPQPEPDPNKQQQQQQPDQPDDKKQEEKKMMPPPRKYSTKNSVTNSKGRYYKELV